MPHKIRLTEDRPITIMYIIDTCIAPPGRPQKGGAEKQLLLIATSLKKNGFRPIIVQLLPASATPVALGAIDDIEFVHLPTEKFYSLNGLRQLVRLCSMARGKRVDIIHTIFEKAEVMGWLAKRLTGVPVWITSRRDLGFKRKKVYDRLFRLASRDCSLCVGNCNAIRDIAIEREGLSPGKVAVIYNALDIATFRNSLNGEALRKEIKVDEKAPVIGMVANLNFEIKGHHYFIDSAVRVLERIPEAQFVLVGDGKLRGKYEEMARSLGIKRNVHFLGKRDDVAEILSSFTVSVLPSTSEGFSNVVLESMAAGKPVIATDVGGNPEMVSDGVTGHLVPPADPEALAGAIISLLQNRGKASEMGIAARKVIQEKFTVKAMVEAYERLYGSLMDEIVFSRR